jgi:hypothetical protein
MAINDLAARKRKAIDIRTYREDRFILCPKHWAAFTTTVTLKWTRVKFTAANAASVPDNRMGVYSFVAIPNIAQHPACHYLLYIGMVSTSDFRTRYRSYLRERKKSKPRDHIVMMLERWQRYLWFYYAGTLREEGMRQPNSSEKGTGEHKHAECKLARRPPRCPSRG